MSKLADFPAHHCAIPPGSTFNETIPMGMQYGVPAPEQCVMYSNLSVDNSTTECTHGYYYDPASGYDSTIVTEVIFSHCFKLNDI